MRLIDADELIIFGLDNPDDEHLFQFVPMEIIDSAPTVELPSADQRGTWIEMGTNKDGTHNIKCSKCGEGYKTRGHARSIATKAKYKFCPNCGARMVSEDDK